MSVTRDLQLDGYRGIVMIYIVCVIHVVNWLDYNIEPYNSFMLFEMPIIFFISGASLTFSLKFANLLVYLCLPTCWAF